MANVNFMSGTSAKLATITDQLVFGNFYYTTDTNELYFGSKKITNAADLAAAVTRIGSLETLTEKLDGADTVTGSIKEQIKTKIASLDGSATIASKNGTTNVVTIKTGITEADGVIANDSGSDIALAPVAVTGDAADVAVDASDAGTTGATVQAVVKELNAAITNLTTDSAVTLEEAASATSGFLKTYNFYQGDISDSTKKAAAFVGKIDIPKDFLVKSCKITEISSGVDGDNDAATGYADGTYIKLVINSKDDDATATRLYINVTSLIDVYTGAANASEVQITVDNYSISAAVVDIDASKVTYIAAEGNTARESVKAALQRLDGNNTTAGSVAKKIKDAIDALDATVSIEDTQNTNPLNITITQVDGVVTSVTGSIDANTYDDYGAADAVLGAPTDATSAATVHGVKNRVEDLEDYVGTIPAKGGSGADASDPVASDVIGYVDYKTGAGVSSLNSTAGIASKSGNTVTLKAGLVETAGIVTNNSDSDITLSDIAVTGAAVSASISDAGSIFTATNVEGALQEVKGIADANAERLTWVEF